MSINTPAMMILFLQLCKKFEGHLMTIVLKLSDRFPSVVTKDFPKSIIPTYTKVFNFVARQIQ